MGRSFSRRSFVAVSACAVACAVVGGFGISEFLSQPASGASPKNVSGGAQALASDVSSLLAIQNDQEKRAVAAAMEKVRELGRPARVIATSPAGVTLCDKLKMDLVGVCSSNLHKTPRRYENLPKVGLAVTPDMEIVKSLNPDWVLSPDDLMSDLKPKYEAAGLDYAFLNLRSVQGMYLSAEELGQIFGHQDEANSLVADFTRFYSDYQKSHAKKAHPRVLVLMGLPGSYIIATPNSYVGNLVELAGGENVYGDTDQEFMTVNTEDMKTKEPDIILRAAHALPDQVRQMFADEFRTNDIWRHFAAVENGRVYDLPSDTFGMSAGFNYPKALAQLEPMLYPDGGEAA